MNILDILIKNGSVFSGNTDKPESKNIGILNSIIDYIGEDTPEAKQVIDADGYIVTPGFIDLHTHSDISFLVDPDADSKLTQGVTFELVGNCGMSFCAPLNAASKQTLTDRLSKYDSDIKVDWNDFNDWLEKIENNKPSINVAAQLGHGVLRAYVMGMKAVSATPEDIEGMKKVVRSSIDQGILGFSTGLWYAPGSYSHTEEIVEITKVVADHDLLYSSHIRSESDDASGLFPAHAEAIEIGRRTGAKIQISHVKSVGPKFWGRGNELLEGMYRAREEGIDVAGDQYPYEWSSTPTSGCMFPRWSLEGGREKTLERLKDKNIREEIKLETINFINRFHGAEGCVLAEFSNDKRLEGMNLSEISEEFSCTPEEAAMRLYEISEGSFVLHSMEEKDVDTIGMSDLIAVASDGNSLRSTGPLSSGKPHPRSYGTNTRFIEDMVVNKKLVPISKAIFRMTALPASRLGLKRRGELKKGYFADINIFKPEELKEKATYVDPHQYSTGMKWVLVNGKIALKDGKKIDGRHGNVVRTKEG
ncbi:MAG: D-aminoacylase [Chloroflexota bacterium]|nr:D-aminoacylase [Chloroflexota bacterium]